MKASNDGADNPYEHAKEKMIKEVSDFKDREVLSRLKITPQSKSTRLDELKLALKKDFRELLVREFTTDWREQRLIRELEIDVMGLPALHKYVESKVLEGRRDELNRLHRFQGEGMPLRDFDNIADELIDERLAELEATPERGEK